MIEAVAYAVAIALLVGVTGGVVAANWPKPRDR